MKLSKFLTKKYIIGTMTVIVLIAGGVIFFKNGNNGKEIITVERKNITQGVSVTGKTKAQNEVELGFDTSGRVARSYVEVGDRVNRGQIIAELDTSELTANLAKEKAVLAEEEEKLGEEGERIESSIREAYAAADNAVRNKADQFFKTPATSPTFEVKFNDGNYTHYFFVPAEIVIDLNSARKSIEQLLTSWQQELTILNPNKAKNFSPVAIERMNTVSNFLNKVAYAVNAFTPAGYAYEHCSWLQNSY